MQHIREKSLDPSEKKQIVQFLSAVSKGFTTGLPGDVSKFFYFTLMDFELDTNVFCEVLVNMLNANDNLSFAKDYPIIENLCAYHEAIKNLRPIPGDTRDVTAEFCTEQIELIENGDNDNAPPKKKVDLKDVIPENIIEKFNTYSEEKARLLGDSVANEDSEPELDDAVEDYRLSLKQQEQILGDLATEKFQEERENRIKRKEERERRNKILQERRQQEFDDYLQKSKAVREARQASHDKRRKELEDNFNKQMQDRIRSQSARKEALTKQLEEQFKAGLEQRRKAREMDQKHADITRKKLEEKFNKFKKNFD